MIQWLLSLIRRSTNSRVQVPMPLPEMTLGELLQQDFRGWQLSGMGSLWVCRGRVYSATRLGDMVTFRLGRCEVLDDATKEWHPARSQFINHNVWVSNYTKLSRSLGGWRWETDYQTYILSCPEWLEAFDASKA